MSYFLNTEAMRVVEKNERGSVTYRKRYKRGDKVDVSHMTEERVDLLVDKGTLVESEDDLSEAESAGGLQPHGGPFGAASDGQNGPTLADVEEAEETVAPDEGSVAANTLEPSNPESKIEPSADPTPQGEDDEVEDVDVYSDMDYADLQDAAKKRDLRYVGVSAEDLRASLRESDNA